MDLSSVVDGELAGILVYSRCGRNGHLIEASTNVKSGWRDRQISD
jgi:hypothetical protein